MKAFLYLIILGVSAVATADDRLVRETEALSPEKEQAALKVPEGFEVQLFAAEPQINKPINIAFDDRGRLWVSSTVEYPYAAKRERWSDSRGSRVADSQDAIKILEDTDGDGRADKVTDFADDLNIPTGVLPWKKPGHDDGCIAWSIPNIWYFADTTGDGKCDMREVLFGPLGYEKDTHGMCSSFRLGEDGWVYATHGFNNTSQARATNGAKIKMQSGHVFRFRPDGSDIEIFTRGQVNPFGLCFDQRGNLYSADCHSSPIYQLLRGADYPHFGNKGGALGFGPTMIQHTHGSTGICGIVYLHSDVWGKEWNDHVLIGNPVNSKVNHDQIRYTGSTPIATEKPDFIESKDPWFRPVDLTIGPDCALYIADFYNRIIGHYEVPLNHPGRDKERGRIWKVVKMKDTNPPQKPKPPKLTDALAALKSSDPFLQRAAASKLQFAPSPDGMEALAHLLAKTPAADTHLTHVLLMAIREHLKLPGAFDKIPNGNDRISDLVLSRPTLEAANYLFHSREFDNPKVIRHIARYGSDETRTKLISVVQDSKADRIKQVATIQKIANGLEEGGVTRYRPDLLTWAQTITPGILELHGQKSRDWIQIQTSGSPSPWVLQPRKCSDGAAATVLSSLAKNGPNAEQRTGMIRSKDFPAPKSIKFWICGHRGSPSKPAHDKNFVVLVDTKTEAELHKVYPPRNDVCQAVEWNLEDHQGKSLRLEIVDGDNGGSYAWLGITRIKPENIAVASFDSESQPTGALSFLADLLKISAPASIRDHLRPFLPKPPPPVPREISETERVELEVLITSRVAEFKKATTDPAQGAALFKTHCAVCHRIEGEGGLIGPQLDGIGNRGPDRLIEDILDPNRNIDAHFYLTTLTLKDGTSTAGYLQAERGEIVELLDPAGKVRRFQKNQIKTRSTSPISLMPATFAETLSVQEFNNLLDWVISRSAK